jgi:hypothetical protein
VGGNSISSFVSKLEAYLTNVLAQV